MRLFRATSAPMIEPTGHFGGLVVADVVPRDGAHGFSVQLSYCPPGGGGQKHFHADDEQLFLVIEGELTFDTAEGSFTLGPQEGVLFMPGEEHATLNESAADSISVVVTVPTT